VSLLRVWTVLCAAFLVACSQPLTVEQQIIKTIGQMETHIEAGESRAFVGFVHPEFTGQGGSMNRDQVRALILFQLKRYRDVEARLFTIDVDDLGGNQALARFRALVTGGADWLPESGQVYAFETRWVRDGDEWLLLEASWRPVPLDEVL
jgi:hypothetical protein